MTQTNTAAVLLAALQAIVDECSDYPPVRPYSSESWLPEHLLNAAKQAIQTAGGTAAADTTNVRAQAMKTDKTAPTPVIGYLAKNWFDLNEHTPAVILNPAARPLDLLGWCEGELMALQAAADVLVASTGDINKGDFSALIVHRLDPLVKVFELAMEELLQQAPEGDVVFRDTKLRAVFTPGSSS